MYHANTCDRCKEGVELKMAGSIPNYSIDRGIKVGIIC